MSHDRQTMRAHPLGGWRVRCSCGRRALVATWDDAQAWALGHGRVKTGPVPVTSYGRRA